MQTALELPPDTLKVSESAEPKTIESKLLLVASNVNTQIIALRAEMYLLSRILLVVGAGAGLLAYVLSDWRRDRRDKLIARLLRLALAETTETTNQS